MTLLNLLPFFPLYYNGETKFSPMHVSDMAEIIYNIIDRNICSEKIECVGPEVMTFKEILEKLLILIDKKKILIPLPLTMAKLIAFFLEKIPKPLITRDQQKLLEEDYKDLKKTLAKFEKDELEHHDIGIAHDAEKTPGYSILSKFIEIGCKTAIAVSKKI